MNTPAAEIIYHDGIWVGYRYFNTNNIKTAYPFGFGLSYTKFEYKDLKLSTADFKDEVTVSVTITNIGETAGKEVVQIYVTTPHEHMSKPEAELRAFAKTRLLKPGESQTLSFELTEMDLASYDEESDLWITDDGTYVIRIGASSTDIRQSGEFHKSETTRIQP